MIYLPLLVCLLCLLIGVFLLQRSHQARQDTGLPSGIIVYADTQDWEQCPTPLFSNRYRLTGRPDYLVRHRNRIIPVEVKSTTGVGQPYESHVIQLAAYCLLVEETERQRPPYGLLHYPDATFRISYTPELRASLLNHLTGLRSALNSGDVARSHNEPQRCHHCGFRDVCSQSL